MAGHSKWHNIQNRKNAQDARRGKIFTKLIKEINVAVKSGGAELEANPRLRLAIQNAKGANMSRDIWERAIKKASGAGSENYVEATFEGYGPDGIAFFIETATDNNTRTVANIRSYFNKHGGGLGKDGCLEFIFERKGIFSIEAGEIEEDAFTMEMIDAGATDVEFEDGQITVTCEMQDFGNIQKRLGELNIDPQESGLERLPITTKKVDAETYGKFKKLLEAIEEDDDVLKVYHNVEYDAELMTDL